VPAVAATGAVATPSGLVLPLLVDRGDGTFEVRTPCDATAVVGGSILSGAHVVLDPGHGGEEPGAVGANGLREADLNLDVAQRVAAILREQGATVVLTRDADVRVTVATRAALAVALQPEAFVSIHHNAAPEGPSTAPGTEAYYQLASPESRRLTGLVVEEVRAALAPFGVAWTSDGDNGAKARVRGEDPSQDYYGVLRQSAGVTAALVEAAYLSNPPEAELLARPEAVQAEAEAIARALLRFHVGEVAADAAYSASPPSTGGSGASGGTADGCEDPPL
jgi:N-acetylmuramoyl-L-alanine amidase